MRGLSQVLAEQRITEPGAGRPGAAGACRPPVAPSAPVVCRPCLVGAGSAAGRRHRSAGSIVPQRHV